MGRKPGRHPPPRALAPQVGKSKQRVEQVVVGGEFQRVGARLHQALPQRIFLLLRDVGVTFTEGRVAGVDQQLLSGLCVFHRHQADISVFSVDLMTAPFPDIAKAHAVMTVVAGKVVYRAR